MRIVFERLTNELKESFLHRRDRGTGFNCLWRAHPEHGLVLVLKGSRVRIGGENMASLGPGN